MFLKIELYLKLRESEIFQLTLQYSVEHEAVAGWVIELNVPT